MILAILGNISSRSEPATGFLVDVATAPESCGDGSNIVAIAIGDARARLNGEATIALEQLGARVREVLSYRAEKLVYVTAEAKVQWGDFIAVVERVSPEADVVSIITPEVERLARHRFCLAPSCGRCESFGLSKSR